MYPQKVEILLISKNFAQIKAMSWHLQSNFGSEKR